MCFYVDCLFLHALLSISRWASKGLYLIYIYILNFDDLWKIGRKDRIINIAKDLLQLLQYVCLTQSCYLNKEVWLFATYYGYSVWIIFCLLVSCISISSTRQCLLLVRASKVRTSSYTKRSEVSAQIVQYRALLDYVFKWWHLFLK